MSLDNWLVKHGMSCAEIARRLGVTRQAVTSWVRGETRPGLVRARQIELLTGGAVGLSAWVDDHELDEVGHG